MVVISFAENGVLPGKATITANLGASWADKNTVYVYYYNPTTNKAEKIAGPIKADAAGNITFDITHCSDYFVSDKNLVSAGILPKTGSSIDFTIMMLLGTIVMIAGISLLVKKNKVTNE